MDPPPAPDRSALAGRIQGFGNVNPPPLEDETGSTIAKRAVGRLGDMLGEEVMLTVEDFREKGAVGAVKDAVADAGDILIDGVSGVIGWIRGDPPPEEESASTEDATKALSNGPAGAAYGISQASPTGGINAVWVMPDEADPSALAQLSQQSGGLVAQQSDPRVPKNIQPYQPPPKAGGFSQAGPMPPMPGMSYSVPGGPVIAPYQPAPSGPSGRPLPFVPGALPGMPGAQRPAASSWGPGGYAPGAPSGGGGAPAGSTGAKAFVERIAKGDVLIGPDVTKRLASQCTVTRTTGKQLGEMVCERVRRLYLGLDGGDPADADAAIARLLALTDALLEQGSELSKGAVDEIKSGVLEELLSLRSSAKHKDAAEPMLKRLGLIKAADQPSVDLLGGASSSPSAPASSHAAEADLLGGAPPATQAEADLLGGMGASPGSAGAAPSLDPLAPAASAAAAEGLSGLSFGAADVPAAGLLQHPAAGGLPAAGVAAAGTMAAGATMPEQKQTDPFGFVGGEMSKAGGK